MATVLGWVEGGVEESEKRRRGKQFARKRCTCLKRVSLYRLLCGSKAEAESPIHKGGRRKEGEFRQSVFSRPIGRKGNDSGNGSGRTFRKM